MNALRFLVLLTITMLLASPATGCRKRTKPDIAVTAPSETRADPAPAAATPAPAPPPANLPTGGGTKLAPSESGDAGKEAVKTQSRFDRNTVWMSKLGKNDPQLRAQVLAEMQKAGLSPAELQELRKQAQMYGINL